MRKRGTIMMACRSIVAGATFVLLVIGAPGCAKKSQLNLEMTREVVLSSPVINEVVIEPAGRVDTRIEGRAVNVRVTGDSALQGTFDVEGRSMGEKMNEVQPGVYAGTFQVKKGETGTLWVKAHLRHPPTGATQEARSNEPLELFQSEEVVLTPTDTGGCNASVVAEFDRALQALTVLFVFNKYDLNKASRELLDSGKSLLESNPECLLEVHGHADDVGSEQYNVTLSMNRALTVAGQLEKIGIPATRMTKHWHGEAIPADTGEGSEAHAKNRRVELHAAAPH